MVLNNQVLMVQDTLKSVITKSSFSVEIDLIVPIILHGFRGHLIWEPKNSERFVLEFAIIVSSKIPSFIFNLDPKNKNLGWNHTINQGFGIELEYYNRL